MMDIAPPDHGTVRPFSWKKCIGLFLVFLGITTFFAPQRARIIVVDMGPNGGQGVVDQAESIYVQPFWGTDISMPITKSGFITWRDQNLLFDSFAKRITVKGKVPLVPKGRECMIGATGIDGGDSFFAWDLWLAFYLVPSLLLALWLCKPKAGT